MARIAKQQGVYIIAPIYEEAEPNLYFNSAPLISPDGKILGVYRKIHIPLLNTLSKMRPMEKNGTSLPIE